MIHKLIHWALDSPLIVLLLAGTLTMVGGYAFIHVNVEADQEGLILALQDSGKELPTEILFQGQDA